MQRERNREQPPRRARAYGHRKEAVSMMLDGADKLARRSEDDDSTVGAAEGASAVDATPLFTALDLVNSCSATDWPVELLLDGGPGGSDAVGALARDMDRLAGSESGSDTEPSVSVQVGTVSRYLEVGTVPREATVAQHEKYDTSDE
eukprot:scaffold27369_cov69-Phaeocystis_antarctica.AAC.3